MNLGLKILDNPSWIAGSIYVRNLAYCLASLPAEARPRVRLVGMLGAEEMLARQLLEFDFVTSAIPAGVTGMRRFALRLQRRLMRKLLGPARDPEVSGIDVLFPAFTPAFEAVPEVFWIPDFQEEHLPNLFSDEERARRKAQNTAISEQDAIVILSSGHAMADFQRLFPNARARPRRWSFCTVLTEAEEGGVNPHDAYGLPEKYLYLPNQFWAHKDHMTAFKALAILKDRGVAPNFACTGQEHDHRNLGHVDELKTFLAKAGLNPQVKFLGLVPRNDQIEIFRHAACVIQPSLFEGWSTVVEDTRAVGRPIVMSDIAVHVEQGPDHGHYFTAGNAESLADKIETLWPKLPPGPDPDAETRARTATAQRCQDAGREFLAIMEEAAP